ncbi:MAG: hypothetical protein J0M12_04200 [Deltaproteobacteria bacterium]|nr:hypothetical protein [Deltaproteobacteria bacterium]
MAEMSHVAITQDPQLQLLSDALGIARQFAVGERYTVPLSADALVRVSEELNVGRETPAPLRVEYDHRVRPHPHATTGYARLSPTDYFNAVTDLVRARALRAAELNFHLPLETQFIEHQDEASARCFMDFVDAVGKAAGVTPVWENAPLLEDGTWRLIRNTEHIPHDRLLCLDTGHLILGSRDQTEALARIDTFWDHHGAQVRHLHIHVNDLVHDQHVNDPAKVIEFLGLERFVRITANATYIFERGL